MATKRRKQSERNWQAYFYNIRNSNGEIIQPVKQISLGTSDEKEAELRLQELRRIEANILFGAEIMVPWKSGGELARLNQPTVAKVYEKFKEHKVLYGSRPETMKHYNLTYNAFIAANGPKILMNKVDSSSIDKMIGYLKSERDLKNVTINARLRHLKAFLRWSYETGKMMRIIRIKMLPTPKGETKYIKTSDYVKIIKYLSDNYPDIVPCIRLYWERGFRASEPFFGELEGNVLRLGADQEKTGRQRIIHLNDEHSAIVRYMQATFYSGDDGNKDLNRRHKDVIYRAFKKACKHISVEGNLHSLRHSFGLRTCFREGLHTASKLMGHSNVLVTAIYADWDEDSLLTDFPELITEGAGSLNELLAGKKSNQNKSIDYLRKTG